MKYQRKYFDSDLLEIDILKVNKLTINENDLIVEKIIKNK